ncbi:MAG: hypothetical protein ABI895_00115 [Deltaproteobacteria bacterium]
MRHLGWVTGLVAQVSGGCVSDFDRGALDGRPCPCLPGWVCDESRSEAPTCVRQRSELADDLRTTSTAILDAGSGHADAAAEGGSGSSQPTGCAAAAAPSGTACPALCDECVQGTCTIRCNAARPCTGTAGNLATLACPAGFHCAVSCESDGSCSFSSVECPGEQACSVQCTGKKSCNQLSLTCGGGPCSLSCGNDAQICRDSELRCGAGACQASCEGKEVPTVTGCAASCSAQCGC